MLESRVVHNRCVGGRELEESGSTGPAGAVKSDPVSAVGADVVTQVSGGFVDAGEVRGRAARLLWIRVLSGRWGLHQLLA